MASTYKTPGVYVEEIPTLPPSIAEVETAIPAFIGYTEKATIDGKSNNLLLKSTRISSLLEFEEFFGKAQKETAIEVVVDDTSGKRTIQARQGAAMSVFRLYYAMQMYFANGGGPCYVVSVGIYPEKVGVTPATGQTDTVQYGTIDTEILGGVNEIAKVDEPTILLVPDSISLNEANHYAVANKLLDQCRELQDRVAILDVKLNTSNPNPIISSVEAFRNSVTSNLAESKYGASYFPYLETILNYRYDEGDVKILYSVNGAIINDDPDGDVEVLSLSQIKNPVGLTIDAGIKVGLGLAPAAADDPKPNLDLYNKIKLELSNLTITLPPSSTIAGIYAKVDSTRGVWKAPANVSLSYVKKVSLMISDEDQMSMNVDPVSGKSVNAIRFFTGKGVLVWGARTLAGNDNEWRYVPVRRFYNYAEESIKKGTQWVVFEPNDANTWARVKGMIESFLIKQWRAGALAGAKPEHAFFVKVGLGVTMTALDILEGRMNIEIGMAVVRPAEFIILKFSHKLQES